MDHLNQAIVCNDTQEKSLIHNVNKFISVSDLEIQKNIQTSIDILFQALEKYSFDGISVSFNGGKDALVTLILYLYAVYRYSAQKKIVLKKIPAIYIRDPYSFPEIEYFVKKCSDDYILDLVCKPPPMKDALKDYLKDHLKIKAILVGARRNDPGCDMLDYFNPADPGWPSCIRIHPIINWRYSVIWKFLRDLNIKYCVLYDRGYTSIGNIHDTFRNPELYINQNKFRPAYELKDDKKERLGRKKM
ncbi:FMN adenylyltransferase [Pneumocystis jirovecii RU7]|uniref:FAD synthase n=1 Tax=Pneumocystis jirovecii (strain RU7) TaxID=1408657 RepID=A0A0W4ZVB6_PNEJ7|nr:FMN adenylyltransferase [Pneumocystis jirovecii RU7]KTW32317.1 hypothetical protein T551_00408 [Pneumocystis jirovecii RU7]